jgi:mono/diheme cytochrome c family protein
MKKLLKRLGLGVLGLVIAGGLGLVGFAQLRWDRTFEAPSPALRASTDSAVIARGRYLAYGPAACVACHTARADGPRVEAGEELPLTGNHEWSFPLGTFRSPNITPDSATGIGTRTDAQLVRMLRYGVRHDGRAALPFMPFHNMSDEDLVAVISFLRSQPPVRNVVQPHEPSLLGKAMLALVVRPSGPDGTPPATSPAGVTVERGQYLANSVADCAGCHTVRNMMNGAYVGARFSGGGPFSIDDDPDHVFVPPNLTPDPKTGRITSWTEEQFVARFRAGRLLGKSPMPWVTLGKMTDDDLRSIFRYLKSLPPVENATGESYQKTSS